MEIEELICNCDFETINEMLKEGKITLRDLIDVDEESIEKLAKNLNRLENINLDDLINAFGFIEDSFVIGLFASYAVGLTESHIDTLLDFIIKNDDIQVLLESLEGLKRSFALRLRNKIKGLDGTKDILEHIENIIYCSDSFDKEVEIRELIDERDFEGLNERLKDGEINLTDLVLASEEHIEKLARYFTLLENVNLDDLINAFGFIEDSYVIGQFVSRADDLTESHVDTLLEFIIKNDNIQVLLENLDDFSKSFILKLGNKINELNDAEKILAYIEKNRWVPDSLLEDFARTISNMHDYDLIERFLELLKKLSENVFNIFGQSLIEMNNVENIMRFIYMAQSEQNFENVITQYLGKCARIVSLEVSNSSVSKEYMRYYEIALGLYDDDIDDEVIQQRIELLTNAIVLTNDLERIYLFALRFWEANKSKIAQALIESKSFKWVYAFAKNIVDIPEEVMKDIVTFVASTASPEFIYLFLRNINLSVENTKILTDAIIKTENTDYIGYSVISLGRKGIIQEIENDESLSKEQKEMQIAEFKRIKLELTAYLRQRGNIDFLDNYDENHLEELEEKLLNSDDSIENPFAPVGEENRMKLS